MRAFLGNRGEVAHCMPVAFWFTWSIICGGIAVSAKFSSPAQTFFHVSINVPMSAIQLVFVPSATIVVKEYWFLLLKVAVSLDRNESSENH